MAIAPLGLEPRRRFLAPRAYTQGWRPSGAPGQIGLEPPRLESRRRFFAP